MTSRTLPWLGYWFLVFLVSLIAVGIVVVTGSPGPLFGSVYVLVHPFLLLAMAFLFLVSTIGPMPGLNALSSYRSVLVDRSQAEGSAPPTKTRTVVELVFAALVTYAVMGTLLFSPTTGLSRGVPGLFPTPGEFWFVLAIACLFLCSLLWPVLWITR